MTIIGTVSDIFRYPVKSMQGERVAQCQLNPRGLAGDRTHALIDAATLKVASAKRPQLWRQLLAFSAATQASSDPQGGPHVRLTLPDGRTVLADAAGIDAILSEAIGRPVGLALQRPDGLEIERSHPDAVVRDGAGSASAFDTMMLAAAAPAGGFFDYAPVHILMRGSLDRIAAAVPGAAITAQRYRPNLVIDGADATAFAENDWVGRSIAFGDEVVLRVLAPTPRCAIPTLAQGSLGSEPRALRAVADLNRAEFPGFGLQPCLGAYAEVIKPGPVGAGDTVRLLAG